jgi:glycosyltransferase involved in cell wall biosynthesis
VVHAHYLTTFGWLARLAGVHPYVITVWGSDVYVTAHESMRSRLWARLALHDADLVTADSVDLGRAAIAVGARAERLRIVQFGVDTTRFVPGPEPVALRARLGLTGRRVIFSARVVGPLYRHDVVIEALSRLPADTALLLTASGANRAELDRLARQTARLGLADRVVVSQGIEHDAMPEHYRLADVVVSIPESDATPVTILEAMAIGRPIVATDLPSVREWLLGQPGTALVPVGDADATARAIEAALATPVAERTRNAATLRSIILDRADQDRSLSEVEAAYRAIAARRR